MAMSPRDALATISRAVPELRMTFDEHIVVQECVKTLYGLVEREEKQAAEGLAKWKDVSPRNAPQDGAKNPE